jgi:L-ascorbate metabolism protein UlaG (beta-lactamase superfamily)
VNRVTWLGHSTALIELGGTRLLTDPVLRGRLAHLVRVAPPVDPPLFADLDAVLISHLHHDHFDEPSLRKLDRATRLIVPAGAEARVRRLGFEQVTEVEAGAAVEVSSVSVQAVPAIHDLGRGPRSGEAGAIGFIAAGDGARVYFAGDTDIFDAMAELADPPLDVALIPVWGWGPTLGKGHLDPDEAAAALALLCPRVAVPIHWGTLYPRGLRRLRPRQLEDPPERMRRKAAVLAPATRVEILAPGGSLELG